MKAFILNTLLFNSSFTSWNRNHISHLWLWDAVLDPL